MTAEREAKPDWVDVPDTLREKIAAIAGGRIVSADTVWGGFGPSATFVLHLASGRKLFCKGAHPGQTETGRLALLRERDHLIAYPELAQFGPTYLGGADESDWHMIVLDFIDRAKDVPPWDSGSIDTVIDLLARFHRATPARAVEHLTKAQDSPVFNLFEPEIGWGSLTRDGMARDRFLSMFDEAGRWFDENGATLAALEARSLEIGGPRSWLHLDVRSDNLLIDAGGRAHLVDWPYLGFGPTLVDIGFFLPSLTGEGGPAPSTGLAAYEKAAGIAFHRDDIAITAATISGFFAARAGEPDIPQLPRLRWIQRLQLFPALDWTCEVLKIRPLRSKLG